MVEVKERRHLTARKSANASVEDWMQDDRLYSIDALSRTPKNASLSRFTNSLENRWNGDSTVVARMIKIDKYLEDTHPIHPHYHYQHYQDYQDYQDYQYQRSQNDEYALVELAH